MKSYGGIWKMIICEENLHWAWRRVKRGHLSSIAIRDYEIRLNENLLDLHNQLSNGTYRPSGYRRFRIYDPKPRTISCAPVVDRIVHHALCNIIAPLLERSFVPVSFACRKGYGAHAACTLARRYARRAKYFCKMDVRKYFESISHQRLLAVLLPVFREEKVRDLLRKIIASNNHGTHCEYGLPIGNLTSQWFANVFLSRFDHKALAGFGGRTPVGYLRYMDDFVFFTKTKAEAWRFHDATQEWLMEERGLEIKDEATVIAPISEGVPFLGLRIWPNAWRLKRSRYLRTRSTYHSRVKQFENGIIDERKLACCTASVDGVLRWFGFKGILDDLAPGEGSSSGSNRVKRGGSWNNNADNCTSSNRNNNNSSNENNNNGFRIVSTMSEQTGFHSGLPVLCESRAKHAQPSRLVARVTAELGIFTKEI